jgi:hypothetical protein
MLILWINNRFGGKRPSFDYHLTCAQISSL